MPGSIPPEFVENLYVVIGIVVAVWVLEKVLKLVVPLISQKKNGNGKGTSKEGAQLEMIAAMVADLHKWHDHRDEDGVFLWFTRRSMYDVLEKLVAILQEIRQEQRETRAAVDQLARKE